MECNCLKINMKRQEMMKTAATVASGPVVRQTAWVQYRTRIITCGILNVCALMAWDCHAEKKQLQERPNIIYIFTDQQSAKMMSCTGNNWLKTPAMDYIAQNGVRFTRAYTTNPVCSPARVSLMTGRFAGNFLDPEGKAVKENIGSMRIREISGQVRETTLASFMGKAGYELVYGGKEHLPKPLVPETLGFRDICDDERDELAGAVSAYIKSKPGKPYFLIVSLINPHDICYMAIRDFARNEREKGLLSRGQTELAALDEALTRPVGISEEDFFARYCPPLPPNFEPQQGEPKAVAWLLGERNFRKEARLNYTEKDWRMHRWAYFRLTEMVDRQIGIILDALRESGQEENTLVLFSSDHGDMDASHRLEHKSILYEEAVNIPFLAMWKGHLPASRVDSIHLVSNGLDLLPTVCDYAGTKGVADPRGRSLRPLFEAENVKWRKYLGVESEAGNMVIDADRYKYVRYLIPETEEQLLDLNRDPYETTHFTDDNQYAAKLRELRAVYERAWFPGIKSKKMLQMQ